MAPATKSSKQATRGAKLIADENASTLRFYRNMTIGVPGIYLGTMCAFFELTTGPIVLTIICCLANWSIFQIMDYISKPRYAESGQITYTGIDLNMEGGIAEHMKDLIILTSGVQVLLLVSNYFCLLWLMVPLRGLWILWVNVVAPWIFAEPAVPTEKDEKKQRKLERKLARPVYRSY